MKVLGISFCHVTPEAEDLLKLLGDDGLGIVPSMLNPEGYRGGVFPAGEGSRIEVWEEGDDMPAGTMLQILVDDADAWAERAREHGLEPHGPTDMHDQRVYFLNTPTLALTFQSTLSEGE